MPANTVFGPPGSCADELSIPYKLPMPACRLRQVALFLKYPFSLCIAELKFGIRCTFCDWQVCSVSRSHSRGHLTAKHRTFRYWVRLVGVWSEQYTELLCGVYIPDISHISALAPAPTRVSASSSASSASTRSISLLHAARCHAAHEVRSATTQ
jgi:hypothetical protein